MLIPRVAEHLWPFPHPRAAVAIALALELEGILCPPHGSPRHACILGFFLNVRNGHAVEADQTNEKLFGFIKCWSHGFALAGGHRLGCGDADTTLLPNNTGSLDPHLGHKFLLDQISKPGRWLCQIVLGVQEQMPLIVFRVSHCGEGNSRSGDKSNRSHEAMHHLSARLAIAFVEVHD